MKYLLSITITALFLTSVCLSQDNERTALFDELYQKTLKREAFSPIKWEKLSTDFETECFNLKLREEFYNADTDFKLLRAILKLNNARKDRHLRLEATKNYMDLDEILQAPIQFYPDLADEKNVFFFVANLNQQVLEKGVSKGDKLIAVNDIPINQYLDSLSIYLRYSTHLQMLVKEVPNYLSAKCELFGPELQQSETVIFTLEPINGETNYNITLSYVTPNTIEWLWEPVLERDREDSAEDELFYELMYYYLGFTQVFDDHLNCAFYVNNSKKTAIIEWYHFEETEQGIQNLINVAKNKNILNYNIIVDATHSGGGSRSALFLKRLASTPFKTTFGNIRVTDTEFATTNANNHSASVKNWILDAVSDGEDYSSNEPFKLQLFARGSDGIMNPSNDRFTGNIVVLFFPLGGSNLDQFAAMIADNPQLNIHTMGMPTGGYSNTWEWGETISLPNGNNIYFEWNVGHTIRPNGEILEGNPAIPNEVIPFTADNYETYFSDLLKKAISHLENLTTSSESALQTQKKLLFKVSNPINSEGIILINLPKN